MTKVTRSNRKVVIYWFCGPDENIVSMILYRSAVLCSADMNDFVFMRFLVFLIFCNFVFTRSSNPHYFLIRPQFLI